MKTNPLIEALGGTVALATALGADRSTVANWHARPIPWRRRHDIAKLAAERGVPLPTDYWEDGK